MKNIYLYILLSISIGLHSQKFAVDECIQYALDHNYDVRSQTLERSISYQKTNEIMSQGFPKINGNVSYQNNFQRMTSILPGELVGKPGTTVPVQFGTANNMVAAVGLNQLLIDGRYFIGLKARDKVKELADNQLVMSQRDVKALIFKSYYQVLVLENLIKMMEDNKKVLDNLLKQTKESYKVGVIEELDVDRINVNVTNLGNNIITAKSRKELTLIALKFNMGYPLDSTLELVNDMESRVDTILGKDFRLDEDFDQRIEIALADNSVDLNRYDMKQLKAYYYPSMYGNFNYGYQAYSNKFDFIKQDWFNYGNFAIQLNVPIFNGMTYKYKVNQAKLSLQKSEVNREKIYNAMKMQMNRAYVELQNSIYNFNNQKEVFRLNKKIETKTQIKYKEGVGSSFEFSQAQANTIQQSIQINQAMLDLIAAYIDYQISINKIR